MARCTYWTNALEFSVVVGWRMHHRHWLASSGALTAFLPSTLDMFAEFILYVVAECAEASIFMLCGLDVSDAGVHITWIRQRVNSPRRKWALNGGVCASGGKWARRYCQCLMPSWVYVRGGLIAELVSGPTPGASGSMTYRFSLDDGGFQTNS